MAEDLSILFGRGKTQNIVAVEPVYQKENTVEVFRRVDGKLQDPEYFTYKPFIYLPEEDPVYDELYDSTEITNLVGNNYYNRYIEDNNYGFIKWIQKHADHSYMPFIQSQWMIKEGQTQFKGMNFDDPLRMYLDIEVYTDPKYDFPNSSRPEDKVIIVSILLNSGEKFLLYIDEKDDEYREGKDLGIITRTSEPALLEALVQTIQRIDPDIIVLHGGFNFDLPYLRDRMQSYDIPFAIGRDNSEPYSFPTSIKFAQKTENYENFNVYGRHILDTYFFARQYDIVARTLPGYRLKECVDHLEKQSPNRTYIEGDKISWYWDNNKEKLLEYALDDVRETQILDREWGLNAFAQTKMCPLPMQDVMRYGTGNKIDHIFTREYWLAKWSIGKPEEKRDYGGGYADTLIYGLIDEPTVYMDVASLYPSLGQILKIQPKKDQLNLYPRMLNLLKKERYKAKRGYKKHPKDSAEHTRLKALDGALKILLNTMSYGYLGWDWGNFNDYDEAERITKWGQKVIKQMILEAESLGGKVAKVDTDGALVIVPEKFIGYKERENIFIEKVQKNINQWLQQELEEND